MRVKSTSYWMTTLKINHHLIKYLFLIFVSLYVNNMAFGQTPFYGKVPGVSENSKLMFWYGTVSATNMTELKNYDVVILEPTLRVVNVKDNYFYLESLTTAQVQELKRGNDGNLGTSDDVIVLAYISIGEMLTTIIPGSSGDMTIAKGIELGLLPDNYSGPSGPVKGPNPWDFNASGNFIDVENGGTPDGTYDDGFQGYANVDIAEDYSSSGSWLTWRNNGLMPWYMDQQGTWVTDSRYLYGGYWASGDGIVDVNPTYGGGYINAGDPAWVKFVEFRIEKLVKDCGFDGVFLDTFDTPDPVGGASPSLSWGPRGNFAWTAKGMVELIEKIKEVDPSKIVASNRGYWMMNPDEGTSQFADRYRKAMNMFVTESWYHNPYITSGSMFYDENAAFTSNWNTDQTSSNYRSRDNFGGFWKDYMNAQSDATDGFNIAIIDFQVTAGTKIQKWMNEVVVNNGYLGYAVHNANHFNSSISSVAKDWLDANNRPDSDLSGSHPTNIYSGFVADGSTAEWSAETPIYADPTGSNSKGVTKVYTKFVNDRFFMMVEGNGSLDLSAEHLYFDFDQNGPEGWDVFWDVSPEAKIYFETSQQVNLYPYMGPGDVFKFDATNSIANRAWPVKVGNNSNQWEIEFEKDFIFGAENQGKEAWLWFRVGNFGGANIAFTVPSDGPSITSVSDASVSDNIQNITWTTDVSSDSKVEYGTTTSYGNTVNSSSLTTGHSINLTGLIKGTNYNYRVTSVDASGRESISGNYQFTTTDATAAPVISNVQVSSITRNSALISWTTDQASDSEVNFGTSSAYGQSVFVNETVTSHSVTITGLSAETLYHYSVSSTNATNIIGIGTDQTFTSAPDLAFTTSPTVNASNTAAVISWTTNVDADSRVDYGASIGYGSNQTSNTQNSYHSITITGLTPGATYHYKATSTDVNGQSIASADLTFTTSVYTNIVIDGNTNDWIGVNSLVTGSGQDLTSMKVTEGTDHIYVLVEGANMTSYTRRLMINADNNGATGLAAHDVWTAAGIDYMVESELQYQSTGTGWSWSGLSNTYIDVVVTANVYEIAIEKSSMSSLQIPFKIGFTSNITTAQLPQNSTDMALFEGNSGGTTIAVTGISVSPVSTSVEEGTTEQLSTTISPSNATNQTVTWSSSNTSVATVSSSGLVSGLSVGSATITATSADGGFTDSNLITVTSSSVAVAGVSLSSGSLSLVEGAGQQLNATISPSNATNQTVTWSSSNTSVATVSSSGLVSGLSAGSAIITITTQDGNYTDTNLVTVTSLGGTVSITIDGNVSDWSGVPVLVSGSGQDAISMKVYEDNDYVYVLVQGTNMTSYTRRLLINTDNNSATGLLFYDVWSSAGVDCLIESELQYQSTGAGWSWSSQSNTYINVYAGANVYEIAIDKTSLTSYQTPFRIGYTLSANISQLPQNATDMALFEGNAGSTTVDVTSVNLSPASVSLVEGATAQLSASIAPTNATDQSISWSSSNTAVATVSANGLVTSQGVGAATITVTSDDGGFTDTSVITVSAATIAVSGVSLTPSSVSMEVGSTQQLSAIVSPLNASNQAVSYSSNNTSTATVSSSGLVMAIGVGSASITCIASDGGYSDTSVITVTAVPNSLPSPWISEDVGAVGAVGTVSYSSGTFTIEGSGSDIWSTADEFRFVYQSLSGDGTITARVASIENTNSWAKAGVMIRESLDTGSKHAMSIVASTAGVSFQRRTATNGSSAHTTTSGLSDPYWVRIVRVGNTFTSYFSANGSSWTNQGSATISMNSSVYIGLVTTSHADGTLCTSTIDNVTVDIGATTTIPIAGKTYYIDNPHHDLRLGANGGEDAYTTATSTTGANVEWVITASPTNNHFYVDCNGGGSKPRIRTDRTAFADMQGTGSAGTYTRWSFTATGDAYLLTTQDQVLPRLQVNNSGQVKMVTTASTGTWEQFTFTEVTNPSARKAENLAWASELEAEDQINIYPVPVSDELNVELTHGKRYVRIDVIDVMGHVLVNQENITEDHLKLDVSKLSSGVYILRILSDDFKVKTIRFNK